MKRLRQMLQYKRPHGSSTERDWINRFIMPYQPEAFGEGLETFALCVTVERPDGSYPKVLFSCHTDTVHRSPGKQNLVERDGFFSKNDGTPLGADDAAGAWIMLEMIDAKVPGVYLFHRGEEQGGIGSKWMRSNGTEFLSQFDYAIAFDRKATHSVITHQGGSRCCSDEFGEALADSLNEQDQNFMYVTDDSGIYTDTKEYVRFIKECTNISVGYYSEHTPMERLDKNHIMSLRNACVNIDWNSLPAVRDETKEEHKPRRAFRSHPGVFIDTNEFLDVYFGRRYGRIK